MKGQVTNQLRFTIEPWLNHISPPAAAPGQSVTVSGMALGSGKGVFTIHDSEVGKLSS